MTPIPDKALEVIAGRKNTEIIVALYGDEPRTVRYTDTDLARELIEARKEIARMKAWNLVGEQLPKLNEVNWSESVQLAYKSVGCEYHGRQCVSRYYLDVHCGNFPQWEFGVGETLEQWGYEAVAWKPILEYAP
jgi:hypothetical protein